MGVRKIGGASGAAMLLALAATALMCGPSAAQEARQGLVSLDDAKIFYEVIGSGDPILVVHGGPRLDHAYLRPGLDALAARNTVIYYDQRGTGRSTADLEPGSINLDSFVADIDALRQILGFDRVTLLGHSFGALIAIEYALRHPDGTRALILMTPVEPGSRYQEATAERQRARRTEEDAQEMSDLRESEAFAARDPATLSRVYRVSFRQLLRDRQRIEELDLDLATETARNGQDVARLLGTSMASMEWWDRIGAIGAPTLVLSGRYDAAPLEMGQALAEAFPVGTFEALDTGHFPYMEDRQALVSAIAGFFATFR